MLKTTPHPRANIRISFEDRGQDFTWCEVDSIGEIVEAPAYHRAVWLGCIIDLETIKTGTCCQYIHPRSGRSEIKYKVTAIDRVNEEEVYDE